MKSTQQKKLIRAFLAGVAIEANSPELFDPETKADSPEKKADYFSWIIAQRAFNELYDFFREELGNIAWDHQAMKKYGADPDKVQEIYLKALDKERLKRQLVQYREDFDFHIFLKTQFRFGNMERAKRSSYVTLTPNTDEDPEAFDRQVLDSLLQKASPLSQLIEKERTDKLLWVIFHDKRNIPHFLLTFEYMALLKDAGAHQGDEIVAFLGEKTGGELHGNFRELYAEEYQGGEVSELDDIDQPMRDNLDRKMTELYKQPRYQDYAAQDIKDVEFNVYYTIGDKSKTQQLSVWLNKVKRRAREKLGAK